jgi:FliI/YscN family ATPase
VGKSTLLGMIARNAKADVNVVVLIGERGREVVEFVEDNLKDSMASSVLVYATAEEPALVRMKAAYTGTTIAEYFREHGHKVLLMMDSVTRFARAQREVGLARGELPARGGFPPSFFAELPRLFERAGNSSHPTGSITAFYTVLVEGGDLREPVADEVKSLLDGHIVLSENLAKRGHRPAIDVLTSISRVTGALPIPPKVRQAADRMKAQLDRFYKLEDAITFGQHKPGMDPESDEAVRNKPRIDAEFLVQHATQAYTLEETHLKLIEIMENMETPTTAAAKTR